MLGSFSESSIHIGVILGCVFLGWCGFRHCLFMLVSCSYFMFMSILDLSNHVGVFFLEFCISLGVLFRFVYLCWCLLRIFVFMPVDPTMNKSDRPLVLRECYPW